MSQDPSHSDDQRNTARHRVLKGGAIVINKLNSSFSVTLRDLSDTGVKIKLQDPWDVPARFELLINDTTTGTTTRRSCEKRWQQGVLVGARFLENGDVANREN